MIKLIADQQNYRARPLDYLSMLLKLINIRGRIKLTSRTNAPTTCYAPVSAPMVVLQLTEIASYSASLWLASGTLRSTLQAVQLGDSRFIEESKHQ